MFIHQSTVPNVSVAMRQSNFGAVGTDSFRSKLAELTSNFTLSAGMDRSAIHAAVSNALAGENNIHGITSASSRFVQPAMAHVVQSRVAEPFNIHDYYPPLTMREIHEELMYAQWKFLKNTDFSGMSDVERIEKIENWFIETFGENFDKAYRLNIRTDEFLAATRANGLARPEGQREFRDIGSMFRWIRNNALGTDNERVYAANRERLFGDKSNEEIKQAIMDRFSPPLTYLDVATMHSEMKEVGLFHGEFQPYFGGRVRHGAFHLIGQIASHYGTDNWQATLNRPVNWQNVIDGENIWLNLGDRVPSWEFINLFEELIPRFANTSGQGNFDSWLSWVRTI
ncbi:MAG: hypothetical protein FWB92_12890 [Oscillospiraceae bacterium]|nr:hypothetical protein [Oscillospiraceae bacterium]